MKKLLKLIFEFLSKELGRPIDRSYKQPIKVNNWKLQERDDYIKELRKCSLIYLKPGEKIYYGFEVGKPENGFKVESK